MHVESIGIGSRAQKSVARVKIRLKVSKKETINKVGGEAW
jgi:hypothetical protein